MGFDRRSSEQGDSRAAPGPGAGGPGKTTLTERLTPGSAGTASPAAAAQQPPVPRDAVQHAAPPGPPSSGESARASIVSLFGSGGAGDGPPAGGGTPSSTGMIMRDAKPGAGTPSRVPGAVRNALDSQQGTPLDGGSGARIVTGSAAAEAARSIDARAFTLGNRVFFGEGQYAPGTPAGDKLLDHELTHVAQQRGASVPSHDDLTIASPDHPLEHAARGDAPASGTGRAAIHRDLSNGTMAAREYFDKRMVAPPWSGGAFTGVILAQVRYQLQGTGSPFLKWTPTGPGTGMWDLAEKVMTAIKATGPDWYYLHAVLGQDPAKIIDAGRSVDESGYGNPEGDRFVLEEFSRRFVTVINTSIARVGSRVVWEWNRSLRAKEKDETQCPDPVMNPPSPANITPSHPMDRLVIGALCDGTVVFDWEAYGKAHPSEQGESGPRTIRPNQVVFEFERGSGTWLMLRVIDPPDATAEEIANALYGDAAYANLLTGGGTHWAFRFPPSKTLAEPYDDEWKQSVLDDGGRPLDVIQGFNNIRDAEREMVDSGNEDAILGAAGKLPPTGADRAVIVQRIDVMLSITDTMDTKAETFGLTGEIGTLHDRLVDRKARCAADDAEAAKWDAQSKEQLAILSSCASGFDQAWLTATQTYGACDVQGQTVGIGDVSKYLGKPLNELALAFMRAAQVSELPDAGRERLAAAQDRMVQLPADIMQGTLLFVHELMRNLRAPNGYGFVKAGDGATPGFDPSALNMEEIGLSSMVRELRDALINNPKRVAEILPDMQKRLELLVFKATTGVGLHIFDEMIAALGQVFKGDKYFDKKDKVDKVQRKWIEMAGAIKGLDANDPKAVDKVRQKLGDLQRDTDFQALINYVVGEIEDEQTKKKWIAIGVLIGIVIVSALTAGAAAEVAGPGAIGLVAEAFAGGLTFTVLSQIAFKEHFDVKDFVVDLGINTVMFGGLGAIGRVFQVAGETVKLTLGARLLKFTLENIVLDATMTAQAEYNSLRATGKDLSASEVGNILLLNLVLSAGASVATRIGGSVLSKFKDLKRIKALDAAMTAREQALALVADARKAAASKDVAATREAGKAMLAADRAAIDAEQKAIDALGKAADSGEVAISAEDKVALDQTRADNVEIGKQREVAEIMVKLEQKGPNDFIAPPEEYEALKTKHGKLDPDHPPIESADGSKMVITPKPVDGVPSEPITVHKQAGAEPASSEPVDKTPPKTDNEALALRDWKRLLDDKPSYKGMTQDEFVARYREGEFFNFETGRWRSRKVQAEADWKRLQKERPGWKGATHDEFLQKYIDGDFWNFETGAWRSRLGRDAPDPVYFPADVATEDAIQMLFKGAAGQELSFKAYYDMLVQKVKIPPAQIDAAIEELAPGAGKAAPDGAPRGKTVDFVRHELKMKYREQVLGHILDRRGLEAAHPDPRWQGSTAAQAQVRAETSHERMLDVTKGLNEKDGSRISELWYDRAFELESQGAIRQPSIKGDPTIPTLDRQPDNLIPVKGGKPNEWMSQDVKLGTEPIDRPQLGDALKWIRKPGGTKVMVKGEERLIVRHEVSFLRPEGAQAHATEMATLITDNPNLQVEIFNARGESQIVNAGNVELLLEPGLSKWLGIPPK